MKQPLWISVLLHPLGERKKDAKDASSKKRLTIGRKSGIIYLTMQTNRSPEKGNGKQMSKKNQSQTAGDPCPSNREDPEIRRLTIELRQTQRELRRMERLYQEALAERDQIQEKYNTVANAGFWKITGPLRFVMDKLKQGCMAFPPSRLMVKTCRMVRKKGLRATLRKVKLYTKEHRFGFGRKRYDWSKPSPAQRSAEEAYAFDQQITFSILVPLYNTPIDFLNEMIQSVVSQTYPRWELCLADGSDEEHGDVGEEVAKWIEKDPRIKYRRLEQNLGISENTNACIAMSVGDYIALFDHDDVLHPSALFEMMKAICEKNADMIYTDEVTFTSKLSRAYSPHFKPDYSPDLLRSYNYICHFTAFSRALLNKVGGFRREFDGSQDYDMILRLTEQAEHIVHIPRILYFWRAHKASVASDISAKPYTLVAARRALAEHLERVGLSGRVEDNRIPSTYRIRYDIPEQPLVSIIIPNMDHVKTLRQCIDSILTLTTYQNYEIIICENNSCKEETFAYYDSLTELHQNIRVVHWQDSFNYSKINNFAAQYANGEYLLFLNNDIKIITPEWLEEMLMFNQRPDIGAVGALLYYPDDTVQHAGVILGVGGIAGHSHKLYRRGDYGYVSRLAIAQNLSAVTAACMMVRTSLFRQVNGFEENLAVAFNDIDLCMKIRAAGQLIVFTPYAEAYHFESKSRGMEDTPEKVKRFNSEIDTFRAKWGDVLDAGDPYYNPNLTLTHEDFSLK